MFQYILFDLDGTLTDPKEGITKSVQFALHRYGVEEPNLDKLEPFIGPPLTDSFAEFYHMPEQAVEQAVRDYRERFQAIGIFENKVYPGIPEMLQKLKEAGAKLAVASSKPEVFVRRILEHFHMGGYFDVVVGSELDGRRVDKEEVVEEALKRLQTPDAPAHDSCVMVGDRKFDVYGGKRFGLTTVGVSYGYAGRGELKEAGAEYIVRTVKELQELLLHGPDAPDRRKKPGLSGFRRTQNQRRAEGSAFCRMWNILFPFLLYYIGYNLVYMVLATMIQLFSGSGGAALLYENSVITLNAVKIISMLAGMSFVFPMFLRERVNWKAPPDASWLSVAVLSVTAAVGINILFRLTGLLQVSSEFERVAYNQYRVPVWQGLLIYGAVSPLVEEVLFRGIIYNRMKRMFVMPVLGSAVMFGGYHGNLVQAFYGFLLGALIAWAYEKTGDFKVPVLFHACANISVFLLTYHEAVMEAVSTPLNCLIFLIISFASIFNLKMRKKN